MRKIGIIGGLAWPSTMDYYRLLNQKANHHFQQKGEPTPYSTVPMVIESLNVNEPRKIRGEQGNEASWVEHDSYFRNVFEQLKRSGAELGVIASNTPHTRLHGISNGLDLPIISILESTANTVALNGGQRALVLGTPLTMSSQAYPDALKKQNISSIEGVSDGEVERLYALINSDLHTDNIERSRDYLLELSERYISNKESDFVCLACTELPLAFPEYQDDAFFRFQGIGFINTTVAHVEHILDAALSNENE
ncbi:aspartate/glutamate racemase family protein [Vibrio sp. WJH972]